jgi:hypothetical protein
MGKKREPLKATLRTSITVAGPGWDDAAFHSLEAWGGKHIGRDYMQRPEIVKG